MDLEQLILERLFLLLQRDLRWPTWGELDRELYASQHIPEPWRAARSIDRDLLWGLGSGDIEPEDSRRVGLSLAGLAKVPAAHEDLRIFVDGVRLAARLSLENPHDDVIISPAVLKKHLMLPSAGQADLLTRQRELWETAGQLWQSLSGTAGDPDWSAVVNRKPLRRYEDVADADQYLSLSAPTPSPGSNGQSSAEPAGELLVTDGGVKYLWFPDVELGHGGFGRVCAGTGPGDDAVAVKRVSLRGFDTTKWYRDGRYAEREEIVHEYLRGHDLEHVLGLLDSVWTEDALFLVYPRAEFSLAAVVRLVGGHLDLGRAHDAAPADVYGPEGPDADQLLAIAVDLARGLVELHEHDVIHRDIKPENALLHDGRWKWSDLGTSRLLTARTSTYTWRDHGTQEYQAPEIGLGKLASERSDIYSLGCTFYALATGSPPFSGNRDEVMQHHRETPPELERVTDGRLLEVLRWMLHKQPGSRPDAQWVLASLMEQPDSSTSTEWSALTEAAIKRETALSAADVRTQARLTAGEDASAQLDQIWAQLVARVRRRVPSVEAHSDRQSHILTWGDRRLILLVAEPADGTCSALLLGTVIVEAEGSDPRVHVANLCAFAGPDEVPQWSLLRMNRNDLAPSPARVSEALADGLGAVSHQDLEVHLAEREQRPFAKAATTASEVPLTSEVLERLFIAEIAAINTYLIGN